MMDAARGLIAATTGQAVVDAAASLVASIRTDEVTRLRVIAPAEPARSVSEAGGEGPARGAPGVEEACAGGFRAANLVGVREMVENLRRIMARFGQGINGIKRSEVYRMLDSLSREAMLFIMAKTRSEDVKKAISNYITHHDSFKPLTTGNDLKKLGVREGPVFKDILDHLKDAKIDLDLKTREDEAQFLQTYLSQKGILP